MAPLRSSRAARFAARSHQETDDLSGYPARHWVKETSSISLAPPKATPSSNIKPESKWHERQMPKGSELYTPFCQELLRRRRAPKVPDDDKINPGEGDEDAEREEDHSVRISKYSLIPAGKEGPGPKFLADRREGLPSLYSGSGAVQAKRKAKVKQILEDGTEHIIEVLVPEGQTVPGEISDAVAPAVAAESLPAGTVVEGVGVANNEGVVVAAPEVTTPQSNRRKPPPPKRKKVHPLKGRKKKVMLEVPNADGTVELVESAASGGTPRPDEDEGEDDEDGEQGADDGEITGDDASPTPAYADTPGSLPEPPRSVPVPVAPAVVIEAEPSGEQPSDQVMTGVDAPEAAEAVTAAPLEVTTAPRTDGTTLPTDTILPADASLADSVVATGQSDEQMQASEPTGASSNTAEPLPEGIALETSAPDQSASDERRDTTALAEHSDDGTKTEIALAAPGLDPLPSMADESIPAFVEAEPAATLQEAASVSAPEPAPGGEPTETNATATDATEVQSQPAPDDSSAQAKADDPVPDELKPEEIALSNPTADEAAKLDEQAKEGAQPSEKKDEPTDLLDSLEKSLG